MSTYRAVVIDDEESARGTLKTILSKYFTHIHVAAEGHNVASGIQAIQDHDPQLVFLDIKMPDGTGFDLLRKIDKVDFEVVFTTAYDNYAIKAFQASAMGYLLKPIDIDNLGVVLEKVEKVLGKSDDDNTKKLQTLIDNYGEGSSQVKKIVIPGVEGFEVLELEKLVRCEGERNYTNFILSDGRKFLSSKTLKEYEDLLVQYGFFRIHKSHLINMNHVERFLKGDGASVEMSDGASLQISRDKKKAFSDFFLQ